LLHGSFTFILAILKSLQDLTKNSKLATTVINHVKLNTVTQVYSFTNFPDKTASTFNYPHTDKQQEQALSHYFATTQPRSKACRTNLASRCGSTCTAGQGHSMTWPTIIVSGSTSRLLPSRAPGQLVCAPSSHTPRISPQREPTGEGRH